MRNVTISGRRTSMKLEPAMWLALAEVCHRERRSVHEICTGIANRGLSVNLTASVRVYLIDYFRDAATEHGHARADHGGRPPTDRDATELPTAA